LNVSFLIDIVMSFLTAFFHPDDLTLVDQHRVSSFSRKLSLYIAYST
jgi:hypothetical protein